MLDNQRRRRHDLLTLDKSPTIALPHRSSHDRGRDDRGRRRRARNLGRRRQKQAGREVEILTEAYTNNDIAFKNREAIARNLAGGAEASADEMAAIAAAPPPASSGDRGQTTRWPSPQQIAAMRARAKAHLRWAAYAALMKERYFHAKDHPWEILEPAPPEPPLPPQFGMSTWH